jgi:hypothetical protein
MTDGKKDGTEGEDRFADPSAEDDGAHTELRRAGKGGRKDEGVRPRPRAKVLPEELRDDRSDDDEPFNDVPV